MIFFKNNTNDNFLLLPVSKSAYDFDMSISGMLFFKRNINGREVKRFHYLAKQIAGITYKRPICKLSELDDDIAKQNGFESELELKTLISNEISKDNTFDYLIVYLPQEPKFYGKNN